MSSGDFAAELRQSVQDHIALIHTAARAAKQRIGEAIPEEARAPVWTPPPPPPPPPPREPVTFDAPRAAVNFFAEEPAFVAEPADDFVAAGVDDEGIPVWEDPP